MTKKINGIDTVSPQQQMIIVQWYMITKRIVLIVIMLLCAATITLWYLHRHYIPNCKPCITKAYADSINKKHAAKINCSHAQKEREIERQHGTAQITNYAAVIGLHTEPASFAQLIDLRLTSQNLIARYALTNRDAVQQCIERLEANSVIQKATFESIEQKNNMNTCTVHATWKK